MIFELCYIEVIIVGLYGDMRKLPIAWHLHLLSGVTLIGVWLCFYANGLKHQTQVPNATSKRYL